METGRHMLWLVRRELGCRGSVGVGNIDNEVLEVAWDGEGGDEEM